jgi:ATP-dependent Clp protease ATP-binding subunit ClpB
VFNVFLQVLDDGRLTDGQGRVVDFKNTLIIMTTNLPVPREVSGGKDAWHRAVLSELRKFFRPEFLNRIDEIVRFDPLSREDLDKIVDIQIARVERTLTDRKITIAVSPEAKQYLARVGYDEDFGARPLKRAIQRHILDPLAEEVLKGSLKPGDRVQVNTDPKGTGIVFGKAA